VSYLDENNREVALLLSVTTMMFWSSSNFFSTIGILIIFGAPVSEFLETVIVSPALSKKCPNESMTLCFLQKNCSVASCRVKYNMGGALSHPSKDIENDFQ